MSNVMTGALSAMLRFRRVIAILLQLCFVILSNRVAFMLRFDGDLPAWATAAFWRMLPWVLLIRALTFVPFRLYQGLWRYTSLYDLRGILKAVAVSTVAIFVLAQTPVGPPAYPRSIFIIDALLLTLLLGGLRLSRRLYAESSRTKPGKRVLVLGAGDAGEMIVRDMMNSGWSDYQPIGFIDDDAAKVGRRIHGVPVLGTRSDLPQIIKDHKPDELLLAIPRAEPTVVRAIMRSLEPFKLPIKTLPNLRDIVDGKVEIGQIRSLAVEDLLARNPIGLDQAPVKALIRGRRVMVTGAGGSIGSELCRQIAPLRPAAVVMVDRYENSLHAIRVELDDANVAGVHAIVADVTDAARINDVLALYAPDILFHAAAHKHVPLMEENPCEAIKNNVRGTRILAEAAEKYGVDRFILISTDKAVNPTSVMGASKRVAELVVQSQSVGSGTSFSTVRFGNVLASNGSVVPRFLSQIRAGGPVTVTHPDMRRFFMLIPEAVQLVLHAAAQAEGGTTYVLEMGEQMKLADMARHLIRLSGLVPDDDVRIEFTGVRPGEKLYEELVGPAEDVRPSAVDKILAVTSRLKAAPDFGARIEALERAGHDGDAKKVLGYLRELVAEYEVPPGEPAQVEAGPADPGMTLRATSASIGEQPCPKCSAMARRSRTKRLSEKIKKHMTSERPFRCDECGWRGWILPLVFSAGAPVHETPSPDIRTLDSGEASPGSEARRRFSPKQLH